MDIEPGLEPSEPGGQRPTSANLGIQRQDRHLASTLIFDEITFCYTFENNESLCAEHKQFLRENPTFPQGFDYRRSWPLFWGNIRESIIGKESDVGELMSAMKAARRALFISERNWRQLWRFHLRSAHRGISNTCYFGLL